MTDPAPLDAYATAKPNEPTFTLQGGDPVAAELVRLWALLARFRAQAITGQAEWIDPVLLAASRAIITDREADELLLRATQAEEVSWEMDSYRADQATEEREEVKPIDDFAKLDIYDIRQRLSSFLSNFVGTVTEYKNELVKREWMDEELSDLVNGVVLIVNSLHKEVKVDRGSYA
jgi:hypothetical protein